jgi:enamine deaminase RidA (YjgF/YER057c/UK114 family)
VRVAGLVRLTWHTGDQDGSFSSDPEEQIRQTFVNIGETLSAAGADWVDVVEVTSYHVGLRAQAVVLLRVAGEFLAAPYPAWSAVGVSELFEPEALVEISCVAVLSR